MKRVKIQMRRFECLVCRLKLTAPNKQSNRTSIGHIKTMYCPNCKSIQDFIQLPNYRT